MDGTTFICFFKHCSESKTAKKKLVVCEEKLKVILKHIECDSHTLDFRAKEKIRLEL